MPPGRSWRGVMLGPLPRGLRGFMAPQHTDRVQSVGVTFPGYLICGRLYGHRDNNPSHVFHFGGIDCSYTGRTSRFEYNKRISKKRLTNSIHIVDSWEGEEYLILGSIYKYSSNGKISDYIQEEKVIWFLSNERRAWQYYLRDNTISDGDGSLIRQNGGLTEHVYSERG